MPAVHPPASPAAADVTPGHGDLPLPYVYAVFFFSGFAALVYQVVWQRSPFAIYGVNIESVTIVVAAFMLGLGLGSTGGGALSARPNAPLLRWFAAVELSIGLYGLASLHLFRWVGGLTAGASGIATLIVDRDYRKVLAHSDQALVLQKGQVVLQGRADAVSADPALSAYLGV